MLPLEFRNDFLPPGNRRPAMKHHAFVLEDLLEECPQRFRHFLELGEDQHALALLQNGLAYFLQSCEFPAVLGIEYFLPQVLIGVIANLLEFHKRRQNKSAPLDAFFGVFQLLL